MSAEKDLKVKLTDYLEKAQEREAAKKARKDVKKSEKSTKAVNNGLDVTAGKLKVQDMKILITL